jgi:putative chitinase
LVSVYKIPNHYIMLLKRGDNNENVRLLQQKLGITPAVTNFGPKTEETVRDYQRKNGLSVTGVVDKVMWDKLNGSTTQSTPVVQSSGPLKLEKLKGHIPDAVLAQIPDTVAKFDLGTPLRLAHFLAQCGHESAGFKAVVENLNYGAKGLQSIFKKYFPTEAKALEYERKPEKIANLVYANRMSNGDEASGDGFKFRGMGYIQLTGRANYTTFNKFVDDDVVSNPDLVATKYPLLSAGWFFHTNGIHRLADGGASRATVEAVTRRVNGGLIGIDHRFSEFEKYYNLLK